MAQNRGWVSVARAEELLGIERKELFRMRDDGTLKLGPSLRRLPWLHVA